jgi:hypothetical protein
VLLPSHHHNQEEQAMTAAHETGLLAALTIVALAMTACGAHEEESSTPSESGSSAIDNTFEVFMAKRDGKFQYIRPVQYNTRAQAASKHEAYKWQLTNGRKLSLTARVNNKNKTLYLNCGDRLTTDKPPRICSLTTDSSNSTSWHTDEGNKAPGLTPAYLNENPELRGSGFRLYPMAEKDYCLTYGSSASDKLGNGILRTVSTTTKNFNRGAVCNLFTIKIATTSPPGS